MKPKPRLDASIATVKIEPWLAIRGHHKDITFQETHPTVFIRICLQSKDDTRYVELKTNEDFEKFWDKLTEMSIPCY